MKFQIANNAGLLLKKLMKYNSKICYSSERYRYDVIVIGGGIIGTAVAKTIKERAKHATIALVEKDCDLALQQSSHNSQVIHAGIYYKPNSLKARLCVEGSKLIYDYCEFNDIPVTRYGKLIIGKDVLDVFRLTELYKRGLENRVSGLELLVNWKNVQDIQPFCKGLVALWSPNTGNTDWKLVTKRFASDLKSEGGDIFYNCNVTCIKESIEPSYPLLITEITNRKTFFAKYAIICLGLHSGTLMETDKNKAYKNISLKVNYCLLKPPLNRFVKTNIYAMPHLDMPFLGVHMSPTIDGSVLLGPSAVPDLKLNSYTQTTLDLQYIQNNMLSKEFGLLFLKNFQSCLHQVKEAIDSKAQTSALNEHFPMLSNIDVVPGPSCIQGQIVTNDGEFLEDFLIEIFEGSGIQKLIINCRFIPSPGATASLAIAEKIAKEITAKIPVYLRTALEISAKSASFAGWTATLKIV